MTTALPADPPRAWPGQDLSPPLARLCARRFLSSQFPAHPSQTEYCSLTEVCYEEDWDEPLPRRERSTQVPRELPLTPLPVLHAPTLSSARSVAASATGRFNEVV